uniref:Epithelial-stromal interaction protein 1 n=1 Tax=Oryzias sinensis TaxID=183150 RepID=A0A8C7WNA3_9TELE
MPSTKVIKAKPVEATKKSIDKHKPGRATEAGAEDSKPKAATVRKNRASSCPRSAQQLPRGRSDKAADRREEVRPSCERRTRSTAPKPTENGSRTNPDTRRATSSVRQGAATSACPRQKEQKGVREAKLLIQSNKAFTVIPPNPKKRREIQKKAEAELAALEELRLSRAMTYVSIDPSSVGGCMSLEEVRLKQQQEMMQAKRKQKQMKKQVVEEAAVLTS